MKRTAPRLGSKPLLILAIAVAALATACPPKSYYVLSPEDDYSDDPSLSVRLVNLTYENKGDTRLTLQFENRRAEDLKLTAAKIQVFDADDKGFSPAEASAPAADLAPGTTERVEFLFATAEATPGTFEVRIENLPVKVWPIIFSKDKPPDFKATPTPIPQQGGPRGPGRPGPY